MKSYMFGLLLAGATLLLTACGGQSRRPSVEKPLLTVTIEPLRYFVEAVGGTCFDVTTIVPEGTSPETYDPTPQQLVDLAQSKAYLQVGYIGFEQNWIGRLKENYPDIPFFNLSSGIELIREKDREHQGHVHAGGVEPHVWNSARNAEIMTDNICAVLSSLDQAHSGIFMHRADSLKQLIRETDREIRRLLQQGDRSFLIYHPALSYFARDYGLTQICIEENGKEPSPAQLQQLIRRCRDEQVRVIFVQQEFDERNARLIATELGVRLIPIHPLSYRWQEEMLKVAQALAGQPSHP